MSDAGDKPHQTTPLSPEERTGLIPSHITSRSELNEVEEQNIADAVSFALGRKHNPLGEAFACNLHRRMFGGVWRWAGKYRTSNKNIGPDYWEVQPRLIEAIGNARYWIEHKTFSPDEIAVRFHGSTVWVHPFPNGNGRWSRLMADVLINRLGRERFSWGGSTLRGHDETRHLYIAALHAADKQDFTKLVAFARS